MSINGSGISLDPPHWAIEGKNTFVLKRVPLQPGGGLYDIRIQRPTTQIPPTFAFLLDDLMELQGVVQRMYTGIDPSQYALVSEEGQSLICKLDGTRQLQTAPSLNPGFERIHEILSGPYKATSTLRPMPAIGPDSVGPAHPAPDSNKNTVNDPLPKNSQDPDDESDWETDDDEGYETAKSTQSNTSVKPVSEKKLQEVERKKLIQILDAVEPQGAYSHLMGLNRNAPGFQLLQELLKKPTSTDGKYTALRKNLKDWVKAAYDKYFTAVVSIKTKLSDEQRRAQTAAQYVLLHLIKDKNNIADLEEELCKELCVTLNITPPPVSRWKSIRKIFDKIPYV